MNISRPSIVALLAAALLVPMAASTAEARVPAKLREKFAEATHVFTLMANDTSRGIPPALVRDARCILVLPEVSKGAFIVGGRGGKGLASCRLADGSWSAPLVVSIGGASVGLQVGVEIADIVLLVMDDKGVEALLSDGVTLGAKASVAAGPHSAATEAIADGKGKASMLSYVRSKGAMASLALDGALLRPSKKDNSRLYDQGIVEAAEVLTPAAGKAKPVPAEAKAFLQALRDAEKR